MAPLAALAPAVFGAASASTATSAGLLSGITAALPSLSTLATAGSIAASGMGALSQIQAGKAAEAVGEMNASLATQEAKQRIEAGKEDTLKISRAANRTLGEQTAAFGASGFTFEGSPLEVMANTAREYEKDILTTGYNAMVGGEQKMNEANVARWQGKQQKKASSWAAGTTLLQGLSDLAISKYGTRKYLRRVV